MLCLILSEGSQTAYESSSVEMVSFVVFSVEAAYVHTDIAFSNAHYLHPTRSRQEKRKAKRKTRKAATGNQLNINFLPTKPSYLSASEHCV